MADLALARTRITEAAQRCRAAATLAARQAVFEKRMTDEWAPRRAALDAAHPAVASRLAQIDQAIALARDRATAHEHAAADAALDAALKELEAATALKASSDRLNLRLRTLKADIDSLGAASHRAATPHIGPDLVALDAAVAQAETGAARFEIDATNAEIDAATTRYHRLKTKQLVSAPSPNEAAARAQMSALCERPGGDALLDQLVSELPAHANARKLVLAAMGVRFGLQSDAEDEGTGGDAAQMRELRRIYRLFTSVPEKHTKNNPSLKQVTRRKSGGSAYDSSAGKIILGDGPDAIRVPRTLGDAGHLPAVDEDCKPLPAARPIFFDWNAQHELGHALDDKKKFMASRAGDPAYGGWRDHGANLLVVAEAAVAEFALPGIDKRMIALYLDAGTEPATPPAGWDRIKAWANKARVGAEPWNRGADCGSSAASGGLQLGGRVYHESYPLSWVSYDPASRAQGLTGYQFRSAGEWFSELYAGYKLQVLKPSHPANAWLDKLFEAATTPP